jgi:hypothetical protein
MRHWDLLVNYPRIAKESPEAVDDLIETVKINLQALEKLSEPVTSNVVLITLITSKLPSNIIRKWQRTLPDKKMPSYTHLVDFLKTRTNGDRINTISTATKREHEFKTSEQRHRVRQNASRGYTLATTLSTPTCPICHRLHQIWRCEVFKTKSVHDRIKAVKRASCCTNCLNKGHSLRDCKAGACHKCGHRHNTLLHRANYSSKSRSPASSMSSYSSNSRSLTPDSTPPSSSTRYRKTSPKQKTDTRRTSTARPTRRTSPPSSPSRTPPSTQRKSRKDTRSPTSSPPRQRSQ